MSRKSKLLVTITTLLLFVFLYTQTASANSYATLKIGMRGETVEKLQKHLNDLGFMSVKPTGYFGSITKTAVIKFQRRYSLAQDGIAGKQTWSKLDQLSGRSKITAGSETTAGVKTANNTEATASIKAAIDTEVTASIKATTDTKPATGKVTVLSRGTTESRGASGTDRQAVAEYAKKFLGVRYAWGGSTPKAFDCSGYTRYVLAHFDVNLNRVSADQARNGTYTKKDDLLPGDLVFFDTNGGKNRINHVGIYIGSGKFIHSSSLSSGVVISDLTEGFYSRTYMTARRVLS